MVVMEEGGEGDLCWTTKHKRHLITDAVSGILTPTTINNVVCFLTVTHCKVFFSS